MRKIIATLPFVVLAVPALAKPAFPLSQFGLPYAPETPVPVGSAHPLYHKLSIDPVIDMPDKIGGFLAPITNAGEFSEALRQTFDVANMLAPDGTTPKARLSVRWMEINAPRKISFSSEASVTVSYTLVRIDNGQEIFSRIITTSTKARGGDATERLKGNARLAITSNLASAWWCIDKAAFGLAPSDCALTPLATFQAPEPVRVIFVPRR